MRPVEAQYHVVAVQPGLVVQVHGPAHVLAVVVRAEERLELRVVGRVHHDGVDVLAAQLLQPLVQCAGHAGGRHATAGVGPAQVPDDQGGFAGQNLFADKGGLFGGGAVAPADGFDVDAAAGQGGEVEGEARLQAGGQGNLFGLVWPAAAGLQGIAAGRGIGVAARAGAFGAEHDDQQVALAADQGGRQAGQFAGFGAQVFGHIAAACLALGVTRVRRGRQAVGGFGRLLGGGVGGRAGLCVGCRVLGRRSSFARAVHCLCSCRAGGGAVRCLCGCRGQQ